LAIKKIAILIVILAVSLCAEPLVDLMFDDCSALDSLPINQEQKEAICRQMRYGGGFQSVYDLLELDCISPEDFARIKPLVSVGKIDRDQSDLDRIDSLYFRIGEWLAGESVSDQVVDEWIDAIRERPVLEELDYRDLTGFQNVSATDAVALLKHIRDVGMVKDRRQLRSIGGLSARGYVSVRSYIGYGQPSPINWLSGGYFQTRWEGSAGENQPYSHYRIKVNNGPISEGVRFGRFSGEAIEHGNWANPFDYPNSKIYLGLTRYQFGEFKIRHFILGDYSAAFGQGVTFETGDYFSSRRTGSGFDIRRLGVYPDLSSSETYAMRGTAFEFKWKMLEPTVFFSSRDKNAILNDDGSFAELMTDVAGWEDRVNETVMGGDITVSPLLNLRLGVTGFYAKYGKDWNPDPSAIVAPENLPGGRNTKVSELDAELLGMTPAQDFRSAVGVHGLWTLGNVALSAEYSEVVRDSNMSLSWRNDGGIDTLVGDKTSFLPVGDDPYGMVAKAEFTTNRVNALALYRHYDIGYDNPYNRGFSEYARYKSSIVEDYYYLNDSTYSSLAEDNPRPMAEDGVYFEIWGRPFRQLDCTVEFDAFKRLADMADYRRIVLKANWRPNNNLTFRLWRKWQGRSATNSLTPKSFTVDEIRMTMDTRISGYSRMGFTLVHSFLGNPPVPRYYDSGDPMGDDPLEGAVVDPSDGLMLNLEYNATEHLSFFGQTIVYRGWLWNFEDNEFSALESQVDALRWWVGVRNRLVKNLSLSMKLTVDRPLSITNIDIRDSYGDPETEIEGGRVMEGSTDWRIQLDYFF